MNYKDIFLLFFILCSAVVQTKTYIFKPRKGIKIAINSQEKELLLVDDAGHPACLIGDDHLIYAKLRLYKFEFINNGDCAYRMESTEPDLLLVNNYGFINKQLAVRQALLDFFLISCVGGTGGLFYEIVGNNLNNNSKFAFYGFAAYIGWVSLIIIRISEYSTEKAFKIFMQSYFLHEHTTVKPGERVVKYFFIPMEHEKNSQKLVFKDEHDEKIEIDFLLT